jgi:protease-4
MKRNWFVIALVSIIAVAGLFVLSVLLVKALVDDRPLVSVGGGVGVIEITGPIIDSQEAVQQMGDFADNGSVKAVVLRIDSPGGVVGPSQEISAEVKRLAAAKPVVVSMGSVAASGGYYIAAPASRILANPGTITGSIGVLMKLSNVEGLLDKIGLKATTIKSGLFKDTGSSTRPMSLEEQQLLQGVVDDLHDQFVRAVAEGRKLPLDDVRRLADGRVYTGRQAVELKLVDRLGGFRDAVNEAGKLAGIEGEPRLIHPPRKRKFLGQLLAEEASSFLRAVGRQDGSWTLRYQLPYGGEER